MEAKPDPAYAPCPITRFNAMVGGKYKMRILWEVRAEPRRYGEIRRALGEATGGDKVTPRVLSRELRELVASQFLQRLPYPEVPPRVEYRLTPRGKKLLLVLRAIGRWGQTDTSRKGKGSPRGASGSLGAD
jgi:DNA-binding HxlR family transcriptional regulator